MFNILGLRFLISLLLVLGFKILNIVDPPILFEPMSRPGHSDPDRVSVFVQSDLDFSDLSKSPLFGLYESLVRDRFRFYQVWV